jgi:hypothetical protein
MKPTNEEYENSFRELRVANLAVMRGNVSGHVPHSVEKALDEVYTLLVMLHNHIGDHEFLHSTQPLQVGEDGIVITGDPS